MFGQGIQFAPLLLTLARKLQKLESELSQDQSRSPFWPRSLFEPFFTCSVISPCTWSTAVIVNLAAASNDSVFVWCDVISYGLITMGNGVA